MKTEDISFFMETRGLPSYLPQLVCVVILQPAQKEHDYNETSLARVGSTDIELD